MTNEKLDFHISGMHCRSCKTLIESEVKDIKGIKNITVDHNSGQAHMEYDPKTTSEKEIFSAISSLNYKPSRELPNSGKPVARYKPFLVIGVGLLIAAVLYLVLNQLGGFRLLSLLSEGQVGFGLIFLIGLLAGFHCVGMCGGLVIAYSSRGDTQRRILPHIQYNLGRIISYTLIGGVLGGIGSFFGINPGFTGTILLLAGVFMVVFGFSLFTDFAFLKKLRLQMPAFVARILYNNKKQANPKGPLFIGLLNGFMPCGPLQAMQLYALTTGSVTIGALSMLVYAVGTSPMLFGLGTAISMIKRSHIGKMMKASGVLVAILGLVMFNRGLVNFGYGFSLKAAESSSDETVINENEDFQTVNMDLTYLGYEPSTLYIEPDKPVRWVINVKQMTGCTNAIMIESLGVYKDLEYGENIIEFTPPANTDVIPFSCWMRMVWGKFVVNKGATSAIPAAEAAVSGSQPPAATCSGAGSCGGSCGAPSCGCGGL